MEREGDRGEKDRDRDRDRQTDSEREKERGGVGSLTEYRSIISTAVNSLV